MAGLKAEVSVFAARGASGSAGSGADVATVAGTARSAADVWKLEQMLLVPVMGAAVSRPSAHRLSLSRTVSWAESHQDSRAQAALC